MSTEVEVRILGPLEAWSSGVPIQLGGTQPRAVLAMLALQVNQVVSMDYLIDGLWGRNPPDNAPNTVQVYISRLRKVLLAGQTGGAAVGIVRRRNPGYQLELDPDQLDLHRFQRLAHEGTQALPAAPAEAARLLGAALDLWRGAPLTEFAESSFAQTEIPRLEEERLTTLTGRIDADLLLGRHQQLIGELQTLVTLYPLHEGLHGQLMLSLYRSGRQAEALDTYRRARRTLAEELGIDPGRALQDLEAAILSHGPGLGWVPLRGVEHIAVPDRQGSPGSIAARPEQVVPAMWNVPARNPHFTGRTGMLEEMHARLSHPDSTTLVIQAMYGMGGVGKSQLAIEYAHRYAGEYGLVWWVDAEQPALIGRQLDRLAGRLGLPGNGDVTDSIELLKAHLACRADWLLIFDNAERAADVAPYRPATGGHIVVTSRYPGWGALGGRVQVDVLDRPETVALLLARLPSTAPDVADRLAAELGDLPLAVAQAAAYMEQTAMDPEEYLRQFTTRRAALIACGDLVDYHGRIDTAWELSLEKLRTLNPLSLTLLQVGAFLAPEPVPLKIFAAPESTMTGDSDVDEISDAVGAAVSLSLVRRVPDGFQLHRLIQAAIRHRLSAADSELIAAEAARLLAAAHPGDPNDPAHWPDYALLAPHILAIGSSGDHHPRTRRLMLDLVAYLSANGGDDPMMLGTDSVRIATDLLARWRRAVGSDHPDTLSVAAHLTLALVWLGRPGAACDLGAQTLPDARRVLGADHPDTVRLAVFLMMAKAWTGKTGGARTLAYDVLARTRKMLPDSHPEALRVSAYAALVLAWAGDSTVRRLSQNILRRSRTALGPNHPTTLLAAVGLSIGLLWDSDTEQLRKLAVDTHQRALENLGNDHLITLGSAVVLAQVLVWAGEADESLRISSEFSERIEGRLGPDHLITLMAVTARASAAAVSGPTINQGSVAQRAFDRATALLGPDHPITLTAATAVVTSTTGARRTASDLASDTAARVRRLLGTGHPLVARLTPDAGLKENSTPPRGAMDAAT